MEPAPEPSDRDWSELPLDALSVVFIKLGAMEVLMGASLVCRSWVEAARLPDVWRSVKMKHDIFEKYRHRRQDVISAMAKVAVDRSSGQLDEFVGWYFVDDDLLKYIGDRARSLKSLLLFACCHVSVNGLVEAKFPALKELVILLCSKLSGSDVFEAVSKSCPQLHRFEQLACGMPCLNKKSLGIATMTELRSLQLFNMAITNKELIAIVDSCPHLESLDIRDCFNVRMDDTLQAKCAHIKKLITT